MAELKENIGNTILIISNNYTSVNYIYYTIKKYFCKLFKKKTRTSLFRNFYFESKKKTKSSIIKKIEIRD